MVFNITFHVICSHFKTFPKMHKTIYSLIIEMTRFPRLKSHLPNYTNLPKNAESRPLLIPRTVILPRLCVKDLNSYRKTEKIRNSLSSENQGHLRLYHFSSNGGNVPLSLSLSFSRLGKILPERAGVPPL